MNTKGNCSWRSLWLDFSRYSRSNEANGYRLAISVLLRDWNLCSYSKFSFFSRCLKINLLSLRSLGDSYDLGVGSVAILRGFEFF